MVIRNFVLQRRDGRQLPESNPAIYLARRGWPVDAVIGARWEADGAARSIKHDEALGITVVPGREFLAVVSSNGPDLHASRLTIVNADGTTCLVVSNQHVISGVIVSGFFRWTEITQPEVPGRFTGIFEHPNGAMYRIDIDAADASVLGVVPSR